MSVPGKYFSLRLLIFVFIGYICEVLNRERYGEGDFQCRCRLAGRTISNTLLNI